MENITIYSDEKLNDLSTKELIVYINGLNAFKRKNPQNDGVEIEDAIKKATSILKKKADE